MNQPLFRQAWRVLVFGGAVVAGIVCIVWFAIRPLVIEYHVHRMEQAKEGMASYYSDADTTTRAEVEEFSRKYLHHRDWLIKLGYFFDRKFTFDRVPQSEEAENALWVYVITAFPDAEECVLSWDNRALYVCDRQTRLEAWEQFVAEYNVADFEARYLPEEETSGMRAPLPP
jgi:hypothetical protein